MTKLELTAYFEAIHAENRLAIIDNNDSLEEITEKLHTTAATQNDETLHIEVFQADDNIASYSLVKFDDNAFTLWLNRTAQIEHAALEDIAKFIFDHLPKRIVSPYDKYVAKHIGNNHVLIKSYSDPNFEYDLNTKDVPMNIMEDHILGQFLFPDGRLEYHPVNTVDTSPLTNLLGQITDDKIRTFAETIIAIIPNYVFEIPAGISSQTNSASGLAEKGLIRSIQNSVTIFNIFMEENYAKIKFNAHEKDMMFVANMFCDVLKHGWQEDYNISHLPRYEHPKLIADVIRSIPDIISPNEMNFIANCVECHMGNNTNRPTDCDIELPMPDTEYKYVILLVQYLTNQKDIIIRNNDTIYAFDTDTIQTVKSYSPVSQDDLDIIQTALDEHINIDIAKSLGIDHHEKDVIDVWHHILESKHASEKQMKYIELAKKTVFR